eukprot:TCONS_00043956-protein
MWSQTRNSCPPSITMQYRIISLDHSFQYNTRFHNSSKCLYLYTKGPFYGKVPVEKAQQPTISNRFRNHEGIQYHSTLVSCVDRPAIGNTSVLKDKQWDNGLIASGMKRYFKVYDPKLDSLVNSVPAVLK